MSSDLRNLSAETARTRMLANLPAPVLETVTLDQALGRVLGEDIAAGHDQPPFDASAMDGWAVGGAGERFAVVGESAAGRGYPAPLAPGEAVRIFTGAPVPAGADRVVIQEVARREGEALLVPPGATGTYIRPAGGDFSKGQVLLARGQRLDPWRIALAAAAGRDRLAVACRPRVAILATGEELAQPGQALRPDQIYDCGGVAVAALVRSWGGEPVLLAAVGDDRAVIAAAVADVACDVLVALGGASVGDHDLVKPALSDLGLVLAVETLALRPGKPTWFGHLADGRRVLGLPGNPASGLVCAALFLRPLLAALEGGEPGPRLETARLAAPLPANGAREHWMRARLGSQGGVTLAQPMSDQESSLVSVFAQADALLRRPIDAPVAAAGDAVDILRLERL